jgi:hypothetical protein
MRSATSGTRDTAWYGCEVQTLVKGSFVRRPFAEEAHGHVRSSQQLEGEAHPGHYRVAAGNNRDRRNHADFWVSQVHGSPFASTAPRRLAVELGERPVRRHALRQRVPVRSMGRRDPVGLQQVVTDTDGNSFLTLILMNGAR